MNQRLINIIRHYKKKQKDHPNSWLEHSKNQKSLTQTIKVAALAINAKEKRNKHQMYATKWDPEALKKFAEKLVKRENDIIAAPHFDKIHEIVNESKVKGIGPLAVYDTALRIAVKKGEMYEPDKIYLHAGTTEGAEKLLGKIQEQFISKENLEEEFQVLTCWEIEDVLCIYKKLFKLKHS